MHSVAESGFVPAFVQDPAPLALAEARLRSRRGSSGRPPLAVPGIERKLVAILIADVEGYSRLMHQDEEATLRTLAAHRAIIAASVSARGGRVKSSAGDSLLAEFPSIVEAVECGVGIQQALAGANAALPEEQRMEFRVGINLGDVMIHDGDVFGDGVNLAARLEGLAPPGGICVTRGVRDQVRDRLPYGFDDLGERHLKNIARPVHVFCVRFDPNGPASCVNPGAAAPAGSDEPASGEASAIEISFWQSVEASGTPAEYGAYLERYPDGAFASLAQARLAGQPPIADREIELAFWNSVKDSSDAEMFDAYLGKFPDGEFASLASIRRRQTSAPGSLAAISGLLKAAFSGDPSPA